MEKNTSEVKGLIREAFKINGLAGKVTKNSGGSLLVWSKGIGSSLGCC